jgi:hypothetical protein
MRIELVLARRSAWGAFGGAASEPYISPRSRGDLALLKLLDSYSSLNVLLK